MSTSSELPALSIQSWSSSYQREPELKSGYQRRAVYFFGPQR